MGLKQKIFHSPGPKWQGGGIFQELPEDIIKEHISLRKISGARQITSR
jgi:hypothetical protein